MLWLSSVLPSAGDCVAHQGVLGPLPPEAVVRDQMDTLIMKLSNAASNSSSAWEDYLLMLNPYNLASWGVFFAIAVSVMGAAWGIHLTGASLVGAAVRVPRITSKNLISVLFCEALAIYGVILSIILQGKVQLADKTVITAAVYRAGYGLFAAGAIMGFSNLCAGYCVGKLGGAIALVDAQNDTLFVKCFVMEIFGEAIGLMGLIVAIIVSTSSNFV